MRAAAIASVVVAALGCTPPDTGRLAPVTPPVVTLSQPAPSDPSAVASAGPGPTPPLASAAPDASAAPSACEAPAPAESAASPEPEPSAIASAEPADSAEPVAPPEPPASPAPAHNEPPACAGPSHGEHVARAAPRAEPPRGDSEKTEKPARPSPRLVVQAGVNLSPAMQARLARVAEAYFRRTGKPLVITSGTRDAHAQASAMHHAMRVGADVMHLYRDKSAAREILGVYRSGRAAKKSVAEIDAELATVIERQIRRGVFVSAHLRAGAADVRSRGMSPRERRAFLEGVAEAGGLDVLEESAPPHWHVQLE